MAKKQKTENSPAKQKKGSATRRNTRSESEYSAHVASNPIQSPNSINSGISVDTSVEREIETGVYVDSQFVDFFVRLKIGMTGWPIPVSCEFTHNALNTKDKAHVMGTLNIAMNLGHSVGWGNVYMDGQESKLSKTGDGIFVFVPDFHQCMAMSVDTIKKRFADINGKSSNRDLTFQMHKTFLEEKKIPYTLVFLRFPLDTNTLKPFICTNEEFQTGKPIQRKIKDGDNQILATHQARKTVNYTDVVLQDDQNMFFFYLWTVAVKGTKVKHRQLKEKKADTFDISDIVRGLKQADAYNGEYGSGCSDDSGDSPMEYSNTDDSDDDLSGDNHGK
jgi:hypothetical protein